MADDVQPDQGQGTEAPTGGSQFDSYLSTVPDAARGAAEAWFKDTSKSLNEKLDEAAELQKTLGPYREVEALGQYQPDQLKELLAWHQRVTSSEDTYRQWLTEQATAAGFTPAEEQALEDAEVQGDLTREEVQKLIEERSQAQVQPLEQQLNQLVEQQQIASTETEIRDTFATLEKEAGGKFSDEEKEAILELGINESGDDWLKVGYGRWQKMVSQAQKAFVDGKAGGPGSPLTAGGSEAFKPTTDWSEAGKQARERWRQAQS